MGHKFWSSDNCFTWQLLLFWCGGSQCEALAVTTHLVSNRLNLLFFLLATMLFNSHPSWQVRKKLEFFPKGLLHRNVRRHLGELWGWWTVNVCLQNPLLGGGDLSTIIERVPQGNSETDGYSKYHNRGGVSYCCWNTCL